MKYASSLGEVEYIESGLFIDQKTGGLPRGRIVEVWGDESTGKTTLCLQFIAAAQRQGLKCVYVDAEHSFEPRYAAALGVALGQLGLIEEQVAEDALNELEQEIEKGKWDVVVIDSIGALRTRTLAEKQLGEKSIGSQAGLVSNFARNIATLARYKNVCVIGINHSFVDLMTGRLLTSGGKKWQYHKALSIRLKSAGKVLKNGEETVGKIIIAEITKDKVRGNEKATVEGTLMFKTGFSIQADLLEEAIRKGVIVKDRAKYLLQGEQVAYGQTKMRDWLKEPANEERLKKLIAGI